MKVRDVMTSPVVTGYLGGHDPHWVRKASGRTARDLMTPIGTVATPDDDLALAARRTLAAREPEPRLTGPLIPPLQ